MAPQTVSVAEVADMQNLSEDDLMRKVELGEFPAPDAFLDGGVQYLADTVFEPQRRTPSKPGRMSRVQEIEYLFDEVCWYVLQHGHSRVPQKATGRPGPDGRPYPIGMRVSSIRAAHRQGRLKADTVARFERLPKWTWDHRAAAWNDRFEDVVSRYPDRLTTTDRSWLAGQRLRLEALGEERAAMLRSYPGLLDPTERTKIDVFLTACRMWLDDHPDRDASRIPYAAVQKVDGVTIDIGRRLTYYRRRYRGQEGAAGLSDDDIAKFESLPGWTWEPSGPHSRVS